MDRHITQTREWISKFVIGLNLCPFAAKPFQENLIRYVVVGESKTEALLEKLLQEMLLLGEKKATEVETTLLIHPKALIDFLAYNDFLDQVEELIDAAGLSGIFQVASFHPDYQFADVPFADPANYTNRSPFPMLHILRETSVEEAIAHYPDTELIPEENIKKLRALGSSSIKALLKG